MAKGFTQQKGIDYNKIFSPVAKLTSWRTLIAIGTAKAWKLFQDDVPTAFTKATLKENVIMDQAEGYEVDGMAYQLEKALYGLKQSAREWQETMMKFLLEQKFKQSEGDPCVYVKNSDLGTVLVAVWVDDTLTTGDDSAVREFRAAYKEKFGLDDGQPLNWCLGLQCNDLKNGDRELDQILYINQKAKEFKEFIPKGGSKNIFPSNFEELLKDGENSTKYWKNFPYAPMLGSIMYAMISTRPDLCHAVSILARFMKDPKKEHCELIAHLYRYAQANPYRLRYKRNEDIILKSWCDASYATNFECKSTSGYLVSLGSGLVSWSSTKQPVIATSSSEAEYIALTPCAQETVWMRQLLKDLGFAQNQPTIIYEDNTACIHLAQNPQINKRTKHIQVRFHWIREKIRDGAITLKYCPTKSQLADISTKIILGPHFHHLIKCMGLTLPVKEGVKD